MYTADDMRAINMPESCGGDGDGFAHERELLARMRDLLGRRRDLDGEIAAAERELGGLGLAYDFDEGYLVRV